MIDQIPKTIQQLQLDHRNMKRLLALVQAELGSRGSGRAPDFDLLGSAMEYALHYPDLCHHPKEDAIFRRMIERDPTIRSRVGDLLTEHVHLAELTRHLAAAVRNVALDAEIPRQWLENLVEDYVSSNRRHIAAEEETFFPLAMVTLSDVDWDEIDAMAASKEDPLFSARLTDEFHKLYDRVMRLAV